MNNKNKRRSSLDDFIQQEMKYPLLNFPERSPKDTGRPSGNILPTDFYYSNHNTSDGISISFIVSLIEVESCFKRCKRVTQSKSQDSVACNSKRYSSDVHSS